MPKKVIVTGVSGMDGSLMVDYLINHSDHKIYGVVRRSAKPNYSNLSKSINNPRFKLVTADLSDSQSIDNIIREIEPDYFINFAAQSFVGSSWQIPEQTFDVTAMGVLRCLEAIRKHAPLCRIYSAGSSEEYGDVVTVPQNESHPLRPQSPYGAAKAAARHLIRVYRESYGLYAIQGTLFNHEGVRRGEEFVTRKITKAVARIKQAINENASFEPLELGNLESFRDWSDAEDFIEGVWMMLNQDIFNRELRSKIEAKKKNNPELTEKELSCFLSKHIKEYVLSSCETHTVREFVEQAFDIAGMLGTWVKGQTPEEETYVYDGKVIVKINPKFYRPAEVNILHGDSSLIRKELWWEPKINFTELVEKMVLNDIKLLENKQDQ